MRKLLFIDTNVFLHCILQRTEDLDCEPLKDIYKKLEEDKLILIMPEITESEIFNKLGEEVPKLEIIIKNHFNAVLKKIAEGKDRSSRIITDSVKDSEVECLKKIADAKKEGIKIIKKILKQKNTKRIGMTDDLVLKGMRRSLLKTPPFSTDNKKPVHTKDQDCIAFESLLFFLKKGKYKKDVLIMCTDDPDFTIEKDNDELKAEIENAIEKVCKGVVNYRNPLEMLKKEFSTRKYTEKDIERYAVSTSSPAVAHISDGILSLPVSSSGLALNGCEIATSDNSGLALTTSGMQDGTVVFPGQLGDDRKKFCPYCGVEAMFPTLGYCTNCYKGLLQ